MVEFCTKEPGIDVDIAIFGAKEPETDVVIGIRPLLIEAKLFTLFNMVVLFALEMEDGITCPTCVVGWTMEDGRLLEDWPEWVWPEWNCIWGWYGIGCCWGGTICEGGMGLMPN